MRKINSVNDYLKRTDKWFVGGGRAGMYAPEFPLFREKFGFWDRTYYSDVAMDRLFTVVILDAELKELELKYNRCEWYPDRLTQWFSYDDITIREDKIILAEDLFVSRIEAANAGLNEKTLNFILWSMPETQRQEKGKDCTAVKSPKMFGEKYSYCKFLQYEKRNNLSLFIALGASEPLTSYSVNLSEDSNISPLWKASPFFEKISAGKLPNEEKTDVGTNLNGFLHIGMHYSVKIPASGQKTVLFGSAVNPEKGICLQTLEDGLKKDALEETRKNWDSFFSSVPHFECSDEYIQKYYWYRWYGLKLLSVDSGKGNFKYPCVFEGIGGFRSHISYSAQAHMLEMRWKHNPDFAKGSFLNFARKQTKDGFIPGHIYMTADDSKIDWLWTKLMYHANWGENCLQVYAMDHDKEFLRKCYGPLSRYARYFDRTRDKEGMDLYDVIHQGETGQEYSSRYLFVDAKADQWTEIQMKGVDASVYIYNLQKSLVHIAGIIGKKKDVKYWLNRAERTKKAVLTMMWDSKTEMFYDVNPKNSKRSKVKSVTGFFPFMTDIVGKQHLGAIRNHLLNENEFWTPFPAPTVSKDDKLFDPESEWKKKRHNCPWSGRVWPMTNSHIADALGYVSTRIDSNYKENTAEFIKRFIRMMFWDSNPEMPNCYEHYNPFTGAPSAYRGVDDYQHSWVVDLIIKYVAGVQPQLENKIIVDPFPFGLDWFTLDDVKYRGHTLKVCWRKEKTDEELEGLSIYIDGELKANLTGLSKVEIQI